MNETLVDKVLRQLRDCRAEQAEQADFAGAGTARRYEADRMAERCSAVIRMALAYQASGCGDEQVAARALAEAVELGVPCADLIEDVVEVWTKDENKQAGGK